MTVENKSPHNLRVIQKSTWIDLYLSPRGKEIAKEIPWNKPMQIHMIPHNLRVLDEV